jgi:molybdate transport system substrate-binding protein
MRFLVFVFMLFAPLTTRAQEVTVFAASSLIEVMTDVSTLWVEAGHEPLRMSFGSSSTLARQIEQGAPANLFASADEKWMDYLARKDLIAAGTRTELLGNNLVLVVPSEEISRHIFIEPGFDLSGLIGPSGRLATGDPDHVPVGIYAEQAMRKMAVWDSINSRLARTDTVRSALLLVERGEAAAGIVYTTDAMASQRVRVVGTFPSDSHDPIAYPWAVTKLGDTADARALLVFLAGPEARAAFVRRGFKVE